MIKGTEIRIYQNNKNWNFCDGVSVQMTTFILKRIFFEKKL